MTPNIIFLKVTNNQEKLLILTKTIEKHFDLLNKILIFAGSDEVATYINELIWRLPEEGFIPHVISNDACKDHVVITTKRENLNQAEVLINLGQEAFLPCHEFQTVYELYDLTHPLKEEASKRRQASYNEFVQS